MINYYSIPKNRGQAFLRKDPYNFPRKMAFFLYIVSMVRTIGRDSVFCPHFSGKRKFPPGRVFAPFPEKIPGKKCPFFCRKPVHNFGE